MGDITSSGVRRVFLVRGATQDVTECDLCGRTGLKSVGVLEILDAAGSPTGEFVYYGLDCGNRRFARETAPRSQRRALLPGPWCGGPRP